MTPLPEAAAPPVLAPAPTPSTTPVRSAKRRRFLWLALAAGAVLVGLLATLGYGQWQNRGVTLTIRFQEVYGLRVGAQVRYRGMTVGEVTEMILRPDHSAIDVRVRMPPETASLAR